MKKFNQVSQKLSAAVAASVFAASAFMLSACGGGSPKIDNKDLALIKEKYPNSQILSYAEAEKELDAFGNKPKNITIEKCFKKHYPNSYFVKMSDGKVVAITISNSSEIDEKSIEGFAFTNNFDICFLL